MTEGPITPPAIAIGLDDGLAVVIMINNEHTEPEIHPVQQPTKKGALRFAVGEPGRRGTIWRLWANKNHDDVYLASRKTANEFKVSLHESGDWRIQMIQPQEPKTVRFHDLTGQATGRILDQWARPEPNAIGWTHALSVVLPANHLSSVPNDNIRWDDVRWLPAPPRGFQIDFEVHLVAPGHGVLGCSSLTREGGSVAVMDALQLSGGEVVVVLSVTRETSPEEATYIARCEAIAIEHTPPGSDFDPSAELGPRHMIFGPGPNKERRIYDLAFTPTK